MRGEAVVWLPDQVGQLGENPHLSHREGAELKLEGDEPLHGGLDGGGHRPFALVVRHLLGNPAQEAEREGSGPDGRVGDGDSRRGEPGREREAALENLIDEPDHRPDDFGRGVVGTRELAKGVIVHPEKVFVEVEPGFRVALADRRPVNRVEHPRQGAERGFERLLTLDVIGQKTKVLR